MDRWGVYEALKGNKRVNVKEIESMEAEEVKEGLIEFLMTKNKEVEGD